MQPGDSLRFTEFPPYGSKLLGPLALDRNPSPRHAFFIRPDDLLAKDHYVPRFYLRSFSPWGKQNQIYVYRRGLAPELVGISSVACDEDYYEDKVDKTLSQHEKQSAPIIKKLLDAPKVDLSEEERKRLSAFVGTLANRTPNSQERLYKQHSFVAGSLEDFFADREEFFRSERKHGFAGTDEELEATRLGLLESAKQSYLVHNPTKTDADLIEAALELAEDTEGVIEGRRAPFGVNDISRVCDIRQSGRADSTGG